MERNADDPDADMFTDEKDSFPAAYRHGGDVQMAKEYILQLTPSSNHKVLAAGMANAKVAILDAATMTKTTTFEAHKSDLTGVVFSKKDDRLIYTCSSKENPKLWDLREDCSNKQAAKEFVDTSSVAAAGEKAAGRKPVLSMDVNCDDVFLAAGTEQVVQDAFVLFWDVRNSEKMLGGYWDSYGEDVTCLRFHGEDANKLASGGTDCLINVFDISQETEDDALLTTLNSEASIRNLIWYSTKGNDSIAAVSHDEDLVLWPNVDGIEHKSFSRDDLTISIRRKTAEWCYLVDLHAKTDGGGEVVAVAKSSYPQKPCLRLATVKKNKLKPYADLKHGDGKRKDFGLNVRCSAFDALSGAVFTGDEDGHVNVWMKDS